MRYVAIVTLVLLVGCANREYKGCYDAYIRAIPPAVTIAGRGTLLTGGMTAQECIALKKLSLEELGQFGPTEPPPDDFTTVPGATN